MGDKVNGILAVDVCCENDVDNEVEKHRPDAVLKRPAVILVGA